MSCCLSRTPTPAPAPRTQRSRRTVSSQPRSQGSIVRNTITAAKGFLDAKKLLIDFDCSNTQLQDKQVVFYNVDSNLKVRFCLNTKRLNIKENYFDFTINKFEQKEFLFEDVHGSIEFDDEGRFKYYASQNDEHGIELTPITKDTISAVYDAPAAVSGQVIVYGSGLNPQTGNTPNGNEAAYDEIAPVGRGNGDGGLGNTYVQVGGSPGDGEPGFLYAQVGGSPGDGGSGNAYVLGGVSPGDEGSGNVYDEILPEGVGNGDGGPVVLYAQSGGEGLYGAPVSGSGGHANDRKPGHYGNASAIRAAKIAEEIGDRYSSVDGSRRKPRLTAKLTPAGAPFTWKQERHDGGRTPIANLTNDDLKGCHIAILETPNGDERIYGFNVVEIDATLYEIDDPVLFNAQNYTDKADNSICVDVPEVSEEQHDTRF